MPLVDRTHDGEAGPSVAVKDWPVDERGKQDVIDDGMYNCHKYYNPSGRCMYY
jgi:hypothetical protein